MNINEFRNNKAMLCSEILKLIKEFEEETDVIVQDIEYDKGIPFVGGVVYKNEAINIKTDL